jgi:hypothetical protein
MDHLTDLSNGYKNIVNNGLSQVCKIKVKENRMGKSKMDKPDPQAKLDARHRTKTNKTKQKQKQNKNAIQNMRKR